MSINYSLVSKPAELQQILDLQQANLPQNLSPEQQATQGFVTLQHNFELLQRMHEAYPSMIALQQNDLAGYCLAMSREFEVDFPILEPMFSMMEEKKYKGKVITDYHYFHCGQICVSEKYRAQGVFDALYLAFQKEYAPKFELLVTYVSRKNPRSIKAHLRVGFEIAHEEIKEDGAGWLLVAWDFAK